MSSARRERQWAKWLFHSIQNMNLIDTSVKLTCSTCSGLDMFIRHECRVFRDNNTYKSKE
jgi:hypothetical protein